MKWYITAENDEHTSTEHFWISDKNMNTLRCAVLHDKDIVLERTCEGCKHAAQNRHKEPCYSCTRINYNDCYEAVRE